MGLLSHSHGADGREEFHVLRGRRPRPSPLRIGCGTTWEIGQDEAATLRALERRRAFAVDLNHLSIAGRCVDCLAALAD